MDKILLVGGAGYVGSVLSRELLERGYEVKILDRLYFGDDGIRDIRDQIEVIVGDVRNITPNVLEDVNAVINVDGLSNDPTAEYDPRSNHEINTVAACRLADACKEQGVRRYIFASSCSIYDRGASRLEGDGLQDEQAQVHPTAVYSQSKYEAESYILQLVSNDFCPVVLRKGTVYGFSPRMRYDLVVNTFVKDALSKGHLTLHNRGDMWRPLVDIRDVARAYIACLEAEEKKVSGEIFNICFQNLLISELALRVKGILQQIGTRVDIRFDDSYSGKIRCYRVSAAKIKCALAVEPRVAIEESVVDMVEKIRRYGYTDFENPRYYNIRWMQLLEGTTKVSK